MTVTINPKRKHIKVGLWLRLLFAMLVAGLCPIILLGYNALESSRIAVDRATDAATEALDNKALEALQVQASQTAQSISHLLETSVQDTLAAALLPRNAEAYLSLSRLHTGELRYPGGTKQAPEERREQVPLYRELTYIDAYGQEQVRILNSQVVAPELLRNVSNPANTTYLTETYFAETSKMQRGQVYISHLMDWHASIKQQPGAILTIDEKAQRTVMGAEYGKFEAVIRFATPVFNQRGEFDGIVMLSLDARHLMEYVIHILPTSEKWTLWPDYLSGNYA